MLTGKWYHYRLRVIQGKRIVIEPNPRADDHGAEARGRFIQCASQSAVVFAFCGVFNVAGARVARLAPYGGGLEQRAVGTAKSGALAAHVRENPTPPQWQMPPETRRSGAVVRTAIAAKMRSTAADTKSVSFRLLHWYVLRIIFRSFSPFGPCRAWLNIGQNRMSVAQATDCCRRSRAGGDAEQPSIFARELGDALIADAIGGVADRFTRRQHQAPRLDQAELLLELQWRQRRDGAEVLVERGEAHSGGARQLLHAQRRRELRADRG